MPSLGTFGQFGMKEPNTQRAFIDSPYTILQNDNITTWDTSGGACVCSLPNINQSPNAFRTSLFWITKTTGDANTVTVVPFPGNTINGQPSLVLSTKGSVLLYAKNTGVDWEVLSLGFGASIPASAISGLVPQQVLFGSGTGGIQQSALLSFNAGTGTLLVQTVQSLFCRTNNLVALTGSQLNIIGDPTQSVVITSSQFLQNVAPVHRWYFTGFTKQPLGIENNGTIVQVTSDANLQLEKEAFLFVQAATPAAPIAGYDSFYFKVITGEETPCFEGNDGNEHQIDFDSKFRQGTTVAIAPSVTVPPQEGNIFYTSGSDSVDFISTTGFKLGRQITLVASDTVKWQHNTGGPPANFAPLRLELGAVYVAVPINTLTLVLFTDGVDVFWLEVGRALTS